MNKIHSCEKMELTGAYIEYSDDECLFFISQFATEEDLMNNHHLEMVGEIITQASFGVSYCPYCGIHLQSSNKKGAPGFKVQDFSK